MTVIAELREPRQEGHVMKTSLHYSKTQSQRENRETILNNRGSRKLEQF